MCPRSGSEAFLAGAMQLEDALLQVRPQKSRRLQLQQASGQQQQQLLPVVGRLTEGKEVGELPLAAQGQQRCDVLGLQQQEEHQLEDALLQYLRRQRQQAAGSLPSNAAAALHNHAPFCRA